MRDGRIQVFDSQGDAYKQAFQVFLAHTDQKRNARRWLQALVDRLPSKQVFIDAGAGNGEVTSWLAGSFLRTIAIEPNPFLRDQLRHAVPGAVVIDRPIMTAEPAAPGDLVLCSHTFYYVEKSLWPAHLERLASWMSPTGVAIVVLQHRDTDCMAMVERFGGSRVDLRTLAETFRAKHGDRYDLTIDLDRCHIETPDLRTACTIGEFVLNLLPFQTEPPLRADVEAYVRTHFAAGDGRYRFSCHQDFLQISPRR
jgi:hypothetical protein